MIIEKSTAKTNSARTRIRGFGLLEILLVLGAISTVGALGYVGLGTATTSVRDAKLQQDVAALNRAVKTYAMSGGDLSTATTGDTIIAKLKTTMSSSQQSTMAGLRSSMVDKRLKGVGISDPGASRAVWNNSTKSFVIATTGPGFREFRLDAVVQNVEEDRKVVMELNTADKWIWSYNDQNSGAPAPRQAVVAQPATVAAPGAYDAVTVLKAPDFSKPGAIYNIKAFKPDLKVGLVDRNTANTSETYYSVAGGSWQRWNGTPLSIPPALLTQVRAYSAPLDPDRYEQSAIASADYETIFFSGASSGLFSSPVGDLGLVSNLLGGLTGTLFTWGGPAFLLGFDKPNSLSFTGASFTNISPDEAFELGTLTYYNGSTYLGTNAIGVLLNVKLNFSVPGVIETLPFTFQLLSSTNTKDDKKKNPRNKETEKQMDDADADYVYIPEVSTEFTTKIKGQTFYLVLRFGNEDSNGFTTIDEFHTHESKSMTGTIYGIFTTHPQSVDWDGQDEDDDDDEGSIGSGFSNNINSSDASNNSGTNSNGNSNSSNTN